MKDLETGNRVKQFFDDKQRVAMAASAALACAVMNSLLFDVVSMFAPPAAVTGLPLLTGRALQQCLVKLCGQLGRLLLLRNRDVFAYH